MAKASKRFETKEVVSTETVEVGVTLELTTEEASFLANVLGRVMGSTFNLGWVLSQMGYTTDSKYPGKEGTIAFTKGFPAQ